MGTTPAACYHDPMRIGLAIVVVATAPAAAAPAPRPGHTVRVERALHRATGNPRFCVVPTLGEQLGYCFGAAPVVGEPIEIVDINHYIGRVHATQVESFRTCKGDGSIWQVQLEADGELATDVDLRQVAGLIDVPVDTRRAHLVNVEHAPPDVKTMEMGLGADTDGDGHIDIEFVLAPCDVPNAHGQCFEVWRDPDGTSAQLVYREALTEGCF